RKGTDLSVRPLPAYELLLSSLFGKLVGGLILRYDLVQLEDRQEHRDHDAADDHAEENDQHRFNQRCQRVEHRLDFFVPEIGHFLEHVVDLTGSFAGRDHPEQHRRKDGLLRHCDGKVVAFLNIVCDRLDAVFDDVITSRAADDIEHFQDRDTAANELRKRSSKSRHANLVHERTEHRQLQLPAIGKLFTFVRKQERAKSEDARGDAEHQKVPLAPNKLADVDQELRRRRQLRTKIFEDFAEDWNHANNQKGGDGKRDTNHDDRVGHCRFDFLAQTSARFEEAGETFQNLSKQTAAFTRLHHADVQTVKNARMFRDRFVKCFTALHPRSHVAHDLAEAALTFRIGLIVKSCQTLDQGNTGLDHGGELAGEKNEVRFFNFESAVTGLPGNGFLLKGKHHQTAAHQASDRVIFVKGVLDTGDDFTGGVSGLVGEGNHNYNFYTD